MHRTFKLAVLSVCLAFWPLAASADTLPFSAKHILAENPGAPSGIYQIDPDGNGAIQPFLIYADMNTLSGGWTLGITAVSGDPAENDGIFSNTGTVGPPGSTAHTRHVSPLANDIDAEILYYIEDGTSIFHAVYTGRFDTRPDFTPQNWQTLSGHNDADGLLLQTYAPTNPPDEFTVFIRELETPVPEPATAIPALMLLGSLLRRRRPRC